MDAYERLGSLSLDIETVSLEAQTLETAGGFERTTTTISLAGEGHRGRGEDVCYAPEAQRALAATGLDLPLGAIETVDDLHRAIDPDTFRFGLDDVPPEYPNYRRWAIESAGLDLALRQREASLADVLDRSFEPVRFVTSPRLGDPPTADPVRELAAAVEGIGFKLDPSPAWTPALIDELQAIDAVAILDLKGLYDSDEVGHPADADWYGTLLAAFDSAIIEDPGVTADTHPVLSPEADRIAWDYPMRSVDDLDDRPWPVRHLNVKPSRFGSIASLCATLETAAEREIHCYGGGQFELGVGRDQLHAIASVWYPDGPNDVAPTAYHAPGDIEALPASPLTPPADTVGLGWDGAK